MRRLISTAVLLLVLLPAFSAPYFGASGFLAKCDKIDMDRYAVMGDFGVQLFKKFAFGVQPGLSRATYTDVAGDGGEHHATALIAGAYGRFNVLHKKMFFVDLKASAMLEYDHKLDYRCLTYGLQPSLRVRVLPLLFVTGDFGIWGDSSMKDDCSPVARTIYDDDFELGSISVGVQLKL